jgi:L-lysine exporter family protein LysE/ArgO
MNRILIESFGIGFASGAALIVAIGAQNAFVIQQGIRRNYLGFVICFCIASDAMLISLGMLGGGWLIQQSPLLLSFTKYFGLLFILGYSLHSFKKAFDKEHKLNPSKSKSVNFKQLIFCLIGFTFLNPHVYLDTVVLLSSIGLQQPESGRMSFTIGAISASVLWFSSLGLISRRLAHVFERPRTWQFLHVIIGALLLFTAFNISTHNNFPQ